MKKQASAPWWVRWQNRIVGTLVGKVGLNLQGAEELEVPGRTTGQPHRVPVNPVMVAGEQFLLSPRGETSWVKNIRVSGTGSLRRGGQTRSFRIEELADHDKVPVMRAYLDRWAWQVKSIMGVDKHADDATLREIAPNHPVFRIVERAPGES